MKNITFALLIFFSCCTKSKDCNESVLAILQPIQNTINTEMLEQAFLENTLENVQRRPVFVKKNLLKKSVPINFNEKLIISKKDKNKIITAVEQGYLDQIEFLPNEIVLYKIHSEQGYLRDIHYYIIYSKEKTAMNNLTEALNIIELQELDIPWYCAKIQTSIAGD